MPLRSVEALQTRSASIKIARDLIMMAARAKDDTNYQDLMSKLREGTDPSDIKEGDLDEYKPAWKDLEIVDTEGGQLVYLDTLLMPPRSERKRLMETAHQRHMSHQTKFNNQKRLWWWKPLKEDIYQEWAQCKECLKHKKTKARSPPIVPTDLMKLSAGKLWSVDLFEMRNKNYLIGTDKTSQYMLLEPLNNQKAATVTKILERWLLMLKLRAVIKSDGGPCFKAGPFKDFTDAYGVQHILTSAYNSESNGQVERSIQEVKKLKTKDHTMNPYEAVFVLNGMETPGGLSTPTNIFLGKAARTLEPNSQNKFNDIKGT